MKIDRLHFPPILDDNSEAYFSLLQGVIDSYDVHAQLSITYALKACHFRLVPSSTILLEDILGGIIGLNNMVGIHLDISKSCKSSAAISFSISF